MRHVPRYRLLITRRDSLRLFWLPPSAFASQWLLGCAGKQPALPAMAAADPVQMQPGAAAPAATTPAQPAHGPTSSVAAAAGSSARSMTAPQQPVMPVVSMPSMPPANVGTAGTAASSATAGAASTPTMGSAGTATPSMSAANSGVAGKDVKWASGGTKSMKGGYDDPFAMGASGTMCRLYPSQTLGPCYAEMPETREDISDGAMGLPMRLSFLVVRAGCEPIAGATVDIWHSGFDGAYSAYPTNSICNPGTMDVRKDMFCRGVGKTDETGRLSFNTIFPGWYSGRTVHVHFTVRVNGQDEVTSQLYFEDTLTTEIQAQGEYAARGMRPITNRDDGIFMSGGASADQVTMSTAKRPDGVLHAWKVLSIG